MFFNVGILILVFNIRAAKTPFPNGFKTRYQI